MKKLLYVVLVVILSSCARTIKIPTGYSPISKNVNEMFYKNYDEFENISFTRHKYFFKWYSNDEPIELYLSDTALIIVFTYRGSNWIFFESATILSSTNNLDRLDFNFNSYDKTTDVSYGVYESIDLYLSGSNIETLHRILSSGGIPKVRLSGKYYKDYLIQGEQLKALNDIITFYLNAESYRNIIKFD